MRLSLGSRVRVTQILDIIYEEQSAKDLSRIFALFENDSKKGIEIFSKISGFSFGFPIAFAIAANSSITLTGFCVPKLNASPRTFFLSSLQPSF